MYSYDPAEELHEAEQELLSDVGDPKVSTRGAGESAAWFCPQPGPAGPRLAGCLQGSAAASALDLALWLRLPPPTGGTWLAEWLPAQADAPAGCQDLT